MRRESVRWNDVQLTGWMEADPFDAAQVPLMQSRMREYLDENGPPLFFDSDAGWIVHMHVIVHHPRVDWQGVRDALQRQWPAEHAVDVQPCSQAKYDGQSMDVALFTTTNYALKSTIGRMLYGEQGGAIDTHPASWMADLHTVIYSTSSGFRPWRVVMDKVGSRTRSHDEDSEEYSDLEKYRWNRFGNYC